MSSSPALIGRVASAYASPRPPKLASATASVVAPDLSSQFMKADHSGSAADFAGAAVGARPEAAGSNFRFHGLLLARLCLGHADRRWCAEGGGDADDERDHVEGAHGLRKGDEDGGGRWTI